MLKKYLLLAVLFLSVNASAQKSSQMLAAFTTIDIFGPFDVELIKADKTSIDIEYHGVDRDNVISEVQHDVLRLKLKNRHYVSDWKSSNHEYRKSEYVKVKVYYTDIDAIEAEAGARVFSRESLKSKNLVISSSMGSEIELDVISKNLLVKSSMGSVVELSGRTENLEVKASMGCDIRASRLQSKIGYIKATMGAAVHVNVTDELNASAGFGASIDYTGGPSVRHTSSSMGAEIHNKHR